MDTDAVVRKGSFTQVPLADVGPAGSSNYELRILTDLLHIRTDTGLSCAACLVLGYKNVQIH